MAVLMRRRPLLRAAAIGGGVYRECQRQIEAVAKLKRLRALRDEGVLSDGEFSRQQAQILG